MFDENDLFNFLILETDYYEDVVDMLLLLMLCIRVCKMWDLGFSSLT